MFGTSGAMEFPDVGKAPSALISPGMVRSALDNSAIEDGLLYSWIIRTNLIFGESFISFLPTENSDT
jgi:hypothetical protein